MSSDEDNSEREYLMTPSTKTNKDYPETKTALMPILKKKKRRKLDAWGIEVPPKLTKKKEVALKKCNAGRAHARLDKDVIPYYTEFGWEGLCTKYPKDALRVLRMKCPGDPGFLSLCKRDE
jgi:hypothetical protein